MARMPIPTASHQRHEPNASGARVAFRRTLAVGYVVGALALITTLCGCTAFRKGPVAQDVLSAREYSLRGIDAAQQGDLAEAESLFERAVTACPHDERARRHYADTLWRRGEVDQAIAHMEEAVRLSAGDPKLLVKLGQMYLSRGDLHRAGELADEAIRGNRQLASAWALQGDVQRRRNDRDAALASYHRALAYEEHFPRVQFAVAELYYEAGRPQRSLATLVALADQYPPGQEPRELLFRQGVTLKSLGRYHDAVEVLETAASRGKATAELLFHLSEARMLSGDETNAALALANALELDPQHPASLRLMSQLETRSVGLSFAVER